MMNRPICEDCCKQKAAKWSCHCSLEQPSTCLSTSSSNSPSEGFRILYDLRTPIPPLCTTKDPVLTVCARTRRSSSLSNFLIAVPTCFTLFRVVTFCNCFLNFIDYVFLNAFKIVKVLRGNMNRDVLLLD